MRFAILAYGVRALFGIVDLVLNGLNVPSGPVIVDFNTTVCSRAPLKITHETQLSTYAYLYRQVSGRPG